MLGEWSVPLMILQHFFHGHGGGAPLGFGKAQPSVQRERGRVLWLRTPDGQYAAVRQGIGRLCDPHRSVTHAGSDDLAHMPELRCGLRRLHPPVFSFKCRISGMCAAIRTLHIHAPAVFLLHHTGAAAERAVLQLDFLDRIHHPLPP